MSARGHRIVIDDGLRVAALRAFSAMLATDAPNAASLQDCARDDLESILGELPTAVMAAALHAIAAAATFVTAQRSNTTLPSRERAFGVWARKAVRQVDTLNQTLANADIVPYAGTREETARTMHALNALRNHIGAVQHAMTRRGRPRDEHRARLVSFVGHVLWFSGVKVTMARTGEFALCLQVILPAARWSLGPEPDVIRDLRNALANHPKWRNRATADDIRNYFGEISTG
jgi:hypothetical protein